MCKDQDTKQVVRAGFVSADRDGAVVANFDAAVANGARELVIDLSEATQSSIGKEAPMPSLETRIDTIRTSDEGRLISLSGEIGPWDALLLDEDLLDAFDEGALTIVIDLSAVTSVDRVAFRILEQAAERQRAASGELFLAARDNSPLGYRIQPYTADEPIQAQRVDPHTED